ncbi:hypothetical protein QQ045_002824 [Rhodiola kirilowii]
MRCTLCYCFKLCNLLLDGRKFLSVRQEWNLVAHKYLTTSAAGSTSECESVDKRLTEGNIENPANAEKMEYVRKLKISKESKMYKYAVVLSLVFHAFRLYGRNSTILRNLDYQRMKCWIFLNPLH